MSVSEVPSRGQQSIMPHWVERNILQLVIACEDRGDISAGDLRARRAVGVYIKGTKYESEFQSKFPSSWDAKNEIVVPGVVRLSVCACLSVFICRMPVM